MIIQRSGPRRIQIDAFGFTHVRDVVIVIVAVIIIVVTDVIVKCSSCHPQLRPWRPRSHAQLGNCSQRDRLV